MIMLLQFVRSVAKMILLLKDWIIIVAFAWKFGFSFSALALCLCAGIAFGLDTSSLVNIPAKASHDTILHRVSETKRVNLFFCSVPVKYAPIPIKNM